MRRKLFDVVRDALAKRVRSCALEAALQFPADERSPHMHRHLQHLPQLWSVRQHASKCCSTQSRTCPLVHQNHPLLHIVRSGLNFGIFAEFLELLSEENLAIGVDGKCDGSQTPECVEIQAESSDMGVVRVRNFADPGPQGVMDELGSLAGELERENAVLEDIPARFLAHDRADL